MTVENVCCMDGSKLFDLKIKQLTIEVCYLLLGSSSVSSRMIELIRCLAENDKSSISIMQVSDKYLILRISGYCRRAKESGNIIVFQKKDHFAVINLYNGGSAVDCLVSLRSQEKKYFSRLEYRGDIINPDAVNAFNGLLGLARDLAPAKSKKRSLREVSCG